MSANAHFIADHVTHPPSVTALLMCGGAVRGCPENQKSRIRVYNCFKEVMPKGTDDDYSYLSEFTGKKGIQFATRSQSGQNPEHLKAFDIQGGAQRAVGAASVTHSWTEANTAGWVLSGVDIQAVVTSTPINEALTDSANSDNW
jgi:hypothetical protein